MLSQVAEVLEKECQVAPGQVLLVGVSGGPDSLCLLDVLDGLGYRIVVAHLDHHLRTESAEEAARVQAEAERRGLPFVLGQEDVAAYAERHALSIEEAARTARYTFLFEQASKHSAQAVVVGHTADDQVETVLMHLLRGAGLDGLKGMAYRSLPNPWSAQTPLIRPLLGAWRSQVTDWVTSRGLQAIQDPSNLDTRYYRNRLRHELIPYLEGYNPRLRQVVWRMAQVMGEDQAIVAAVVEAAWQGCALESGPGYVAFDPQALAGQPVGVQRRLVRRAASLLRPGLRDIDFEAVERTRQFLENPTRSGERDLAGGLRLKLADHRLYLAAWEAELPLAGHGESWPQLSGESLLLPVPGQVELPGGWRLTTQLEQAHVWQEQATTNADPFQAWLDAGHLSLPLQVRARRPGDRFRPLGLEGHSTKLSDFLINRRLPQAARDGWPLVLSQEEIAWVPGYRLAHPFRVTEATRQAVHLQLRR